MTTPPSPPSPSPPPPVEDINASESDVAIATESEMITDSATRLMITRMELENFKSYAGVKSIGPFHKSFSSVVGPNGSGKSNVIDAMLFVFGKRAKKLRLNKVSELIHNSDQFKDEPLEYARVSVYFQDIIDTGEGDEDYEIVPDTEVVVTRVARRDNSSTYKLNGKTTQFKEVARFLGSKGIDLDNNRFLILQGEVEMISMMPPKGKTENDEGLLEYLEDIIGSNQYVDAANEAAEKVEALNEQRQERLNRVKAVEKEKDGLEGAKLEAEGLLHKERDIRRNKHLLCQIHAAEVRMEEEQVARERAEAEENLKQKREQLNTALYRVNEIEAGHSEHNAEFEKLHQEVLRTKEAFTAYERRDIMLREDIKHKKASKKKLVVKIEKEGEKAEAAREKSVRAEESIPKIEKTILELEVIKKKEDAMLDTIFEEMKEVTESLRRDLEVKSQELAPVQQERSVFQAALDTAVTEAKLIEDATNRAKEQLTSVESELASIDNTQSSKRSELSALEDELARCESRLDEAKSEEKSTENEEKILAKKYNELTTRIEEAKAAAQSDGRGRSKVLQCILKASKKGGELANAGVLGRLGDLATIPEKYDVAVSTACGMLDHIVVESTSGAKQCLNFLRKHNLGRGNFLPLDKMKKGAHDRAVETPEGSPRLFELICPTNPDVTPALYLAVGNTLVAPDLEVASRWAYEYDKRWRVVTVDGKLIETSGAMSGGGNSVRRGGMKLRNVKSGSSTNNLIVSEEEEDSSIQELESVAASTQTRLKETRNKRIVLTNEIRELVKKIKSLRIKVPKISLEIESCDTTRVELSKRIPELRQMTVLTTDEEEKLTSLKRKVEKCKMDMASCALQASKLEAEVAKIQKSILDAGGPRLKQQQLKCDIAKEDLNSSYKELNAAKVTISSSNKAASKHDESKAATEKELEQLDRSLDELKTEFKNLENDAYAVMEAFETAKELETKKQKELDDVRKESDKLRKEQSSIKNMEIELVAKFEDFDRQFNECKNRALYWQAEMNKLNAAEEADDAYLSDEEDESEKGTNSHTSGDDDIEMEDSEKDDGDEKPVDSEESNENNSALKLLSSSMLAKYDKNDLKQTIQMLEQERERMAKNTNMAAIEEYRKKEADYLAKVHELDEITTQRNEARKEHERLRRLRLEKFMDGFAQITLKLKEMYQMVTLGGDAELELVDSLDPFSEGIVFSVRPPKKSWKNISNLSGGEKTLSSLALVFALHHYKPTPLYVMDEIDAALDFKNVSIVANYIKERTKNAQFIIISLRNNMFELADRLVGIYKTNNCTKSVTINPREFGKNARVRMSEKPSQGRVSLGDRTNTDQVVTTA